MFKLTLTISTSVFLLTTGTDALFAMEPIEDQGLRNTTSSIPAPPKDLLPLILAEASKGPHHPTTFRLVCKEWSTTMDKVNNSSEKNILKLHGDLVQTCINTWAFERFNHGVLRYKGSQNAEEKLFKFSELKDGTFDLSSCGDTGQYLVITTSMDRFFQLGEENEGKTVILIMKARR